MSQRSRSERTSADSAGPTGGDVERGRAAAQRLNWAATFDALSQAERSGPLAADDLELLATAAYLLGRVADCLGALQRAHQGYLASGERRRAARCAFWLGFILLLQGDLAQAGGWLARAQRTVADEQQECAEHGLLLLPSVLEADASADFAGAHRLAAQAAEIGRRTGDIDLTSLALHFGGRALVKAGRVRDGLAMLDESMVAVVAGELAPYVAGNIYCSMIDACRQVAELRRAHEWTVALTTWCDSQPDMVTFTGQCLTHRAEIMQLRGEWPEAVAEAKRACDRFTHAADRAATGAARYRLGEIYRAQGELALAAEAYRQSGEWGYDPQPGLALLWLAGGRTETARAAIDRALAEATVRIERARLLPAVVEIALAAGDRETASSAVAELEEIAESYATTALNAAAAQAHGAVLLTGGKPRDALPPLRSAWQAWQELEAPYEAARVRVMIGRACRALGDDETAALELHAARRVFAQLGAATELARLDPLLPAPAPRGSHRLSARELQVLNLVAAGKSNRDIAGALVISQHTVARHLQNIYTKLGVSSRTAATAYAFEHELI